MYGRTYIVFLIGQLTVYTYIITALGIINIKLGQLKYKEEKNIRLFLISFMVEGYLPYVVEGYLLW